MIIILMNSNQINLFFYGSSFLYPILEIFAYLKLMKMFYSFF